MEKISGCTDSLTDEARTVDIRTATYPKLTLAKALECSESCIKIRGGAGTGKTEYLIRRAASLLESGVEAFDICIVVSSSDAAQALRIRLANANAMGKDVKIVTAMQLCREILSTSSAIEENGRPPRILNEAEYKFVLEDIKTLGLQPSRLKKMLNYFYFQWSQLEPEEEWLLPREEYDVRRALDNHLRIRKAMLREEVAPLCAAFLARNSRSQTLGFLHVLVDDYQNLSKASQFVCEKLSRETLVITGNEFQLVEGFDPYPYQEGFVNFEQVHENAVCIQLYENLRAPRAIAEIGNALCLQNTETPCSPVVIEDDLDKNIITQIKWNFPDDEFMGLPYVVKSLLAGNPDIKARDVYIVAPNKAWAHALGHNLQNLGIASTIALDSQALIGDPRSIEKASMLIVYTKLNLAADPTDVVAWRSWCGFDDHLCYSGAWNRLESWAEEKGSDILEALASLENMSEDPFLEASVLRERYRTGNEVVAHLSGKCGFALEKALVDKAGMDEFEDLLGPICGDENAAQLFERVNSRILESSFEESVQKVRIGSYRRLQGMSPKILMISGLIDGFMPSRNSFDIALLEKDRERELNTCRHIFYNAITKASDCLILSTIQKAELELAEILKMEVRRVKMEHGKRLAMLSPSVFIAESGEFIPGALSGQQYLSEL